MNSISSLKKSKKFNNVRTNLLIISNDENNLYLKNSKILHNSEQITEIIKKYETFEVKLNNPTINSNINFSIGDKRMTNINIIPSLNDNKKLNYINGLNFGNFFENKKITFSKQKMFRNSKILIENFELNEKEKIQINDVENNNFISKEKITKSQKFNSNSMIFSTSVIYENIEKKEELIKSNKIQKSFEYLEKLVHSMKIVKKQNSENNDLLEKYDELLDILENKDLKEEKNLIEERIKKVAKKTFDKFEKKKFEEKHPAIFKSPKKFCTFKEKNSKEKVNLENSYKKENNSNKKQAKKNSLKLPPSGKNKNSEIKIITSPKNDLKIKEDLVFAPFSTRNIKNDKDNYRSCSFNSESYPKSKIRLNRDINDLKNNYSEKLKKVNEENGISKKNNIKYFEEIFNEKSKEKIKSESVNKKFEVENNIFEKNRLSKEFKMIKLKKEDNNKIFYGIETNNNNHSGYFTNELKEFEMSNITSNSLLSNNEYISNNYLKSCNSNNAFSSVSFYDPDTDSIDNRNKNSNYISISKMNNFESNSYNTKNSYVTDNSKSLSNITIISDNEI